MRRDFRPGLLIAVLALAVACGRPEPPPVAVRQPSVDADDLAVVRALFDDLLRPRRADGRARGARFLVVDMTMAMCRRDPAAFGPQPGRCLLPSESELVSETVPAHISPMVAVNFPVWNATPLSIAGPLGDDVAYVSPTLIDTVAPSELLRRYPRGSEVVMLSAPGYPAPRMAVLTFSTIIDAGAARLERQPDGRWRVAAHVIRHVD
jgi:hypothetical protein